jgi:hypothetical protein
MDDARDPPDNPEANVYADVCCGARSDQIQGAERAFR